MLLFFPKPSFHFFPFRFGKKIAVLKLTLTLYAWWFCTTVHMKQSVANKAATTWPICVYYNYIHIIWYSYIIYDIMPGLGYQRGRIYQQARDDGGFNCKYPPLSLNCSSFSCSHVNLFDPPIDNIVFGLGGIWYVCQTQYWNNNAPGMAQKIRLKVNSISKKVP